MTTFHVPEKVTVSRAVTGEAEDVTFEFKRGNHSPEPGSLEETALIDLAHNGLATAPDIVPLIGVEEQPPAVEDSEPEPEAAPRQKKEA